jgi:hypothetical protein
MLAYGDSSGSVNVKSTFPLVDGCPAAVSHTVADVVVTCNFFTMFLLITLEVAPLSSRTLMRLSFSLPLRILRIANTTGTNSLVLFIRLFGWTLRDDSSRWSFRRSSPLKNVFTTFSLMPVPSGS